MASVKSTEVHSAASPDLLNSCPNFPIQLLDESVFGRRTWLPRKCHLSRRAFPSAAVMRIKYVPLLQTIRDLYAMPRSTDRFQAYLRQMLNERRDDVELAPLVAVNPMAREHAAVLLDEYLALGADRLAGKIASDVAAEFPRIEQEFKASLVLVDDAKGGWTSRAASDLHFRSAAVSHNSRDWISGILWTSEPATVERVRIAVETAIRRTAWIVQYGPPKSLRDFLRQEGAVLSQARCSEPALSQDDLEYTRYVVEPCLEAEDMRTILECLFGDEAARTLGFTPRGLSPNAGLALALADAVQAQSGISKNS